MFFSLLEACRSKHLVPAQEYTTECAQQGGKDYSILKKKKNKLSCGLYLIDVYQTDMESAYN